MQDLFPNQYCEWLIDPVGGAAAIVIEFVECDLMGASLQIWDGSSVAGELLYQCSDCQVIV